jgi:hypothetical protein
MLPTDRFSDQDAQTLVNAAENSPLANLASATMLAQLIVRFQTFYAQACATLNSQAAEKSAQVPVGLNSTGPAPVAALGLGPPAADVANANPQADRPQELADKNYNARPSTRAAAERANAAAVDATVEELSKLGPTA